MAWSLKPGKIDVTGALTLVVARMRGKNVEGWRVEVESDAEQALRDQCTKTVSAIAERKPVQYGPDLNLGIDSDAHYLALGGVTFGQHSSSAPAGVEIATAILERLQESTTLETITAGSVPRTKFTFYAAIIGDDPDNRFAFIKKKNPIIVVKKRWAAVLQQRRLRMLEEPLFVFDDRFDIVIGGGGLAALNQSILEQLFRDHSAVSGRFPTYVEAVTAALPVDPASAEDLKLKCATNAQIARKMRAIYESGHLTKDTISIPKLRSYAREHEIDISGVIKKGKLHLDGSDVPTLLKLLNEDLWIGRLTRRKLEANGKVVRA